MAAPHRTRQPAELEMIGGKGTRQRCWEAIRARRDGFTLLDIAHKAAADIATTKTYLQALEKGGFIEVGNRERGGHDEKHYRLAKDNGLEAPRLTRDGQPVTQGRAQEQMWRTMRIMGGDFNYQELAALASTSEVAVSPVAARDYLKHLAHAGYVTVVAQGKGRGAGGVANRYRFNPGRYSGPRPPMVQRTKSVYDPNLGRVVWQEEADHDDL
ncbi:hypothetical protein [Crenobacter luteus]|uniref:HTH iclR-type domain-containing protein n=1 Tax=Crenobacter luteus TaxID=1452487 RepID=A0A163D8X6_9NEIS|nr:hypothetical protein [Crenobacter luteus]KZE34156.1 hypothetical protein AVW16_06685 [Crenobacter luteus]